jgi:hypothetical protein
MSGTGDVVTIEDGFTSLSSIYVSGDSNIIEAVTSSTTQLLTYTDSGASNSATIEAIDVSLVITGETNNVDVKGAVSNVVLSGVGGTVLVEGDVAEVVANGINNLILVNGNNGCAGFPAGGGSGISDTCSTSIRPVMVSGTQSCTSTAQIYECTSIFRDSGSSTLQGCTCGTPGSASITIGGVKIGSGGSAARVSSARSVRVCRLAESAKYFLLFKKEYPDLIPL